MNPLQFPFSSALFGRWGRGVGLLVALMGCDRSDKGEGEGEPRQTGGFSGGNAGGADGGGNGSQGMAGAGDGAAAGLGGAPVSVHCPVAREDGILLRASEEDNYRFESRIQLDVQRVMPQTPLGFEWAGLSQNFLEQPLVASDIQGVHLVIWSYSAEDLAAALNADDLPQKKIEGLPLSFATQGTRTSATLREFGLLGIPINDENFEQEVMPWFDPGLFPPETTTYTIMASKSAAPGEETQMIQAFVLDDGSELDVVSIGDSSMKLEWTADLSAMIPVPVPEHYPQLTLDWSEIRTNAMGREFIATSITQVVIGAYSVSLNQLESDFINIELAADELYRVDVPVGTKADLAEAKTDEGRAFEGIDDQRTWLVGVLCEDCYNPAPWYLSLLTVCD